MPPIALTAPSSGAILLFQLAVEPLLKVELSDDQLSRLHSAFVDYALERDQQGRPALDPAAEISGVCDRFSLIAGTVVTPATAVLMLNHSLRHARQSIAGDVLNTQAARLGKLHASKPWQYRAEASRFACECIVFVQQSPVPCSFSICFYSGSLRAADHDFVPGRAA